MNCSKTKRMIEANFLLSTLTCKLISISIYNNGLQEYKEMVKSNLLKADYTLEEIEIVLKALDVLSSVEE